MGPKKGEKRGSKDSGKSGHSGNSGNSGKTGKKRKSKKRSSQEDPLTLPAELPEPGQEPSLQLPPDGNEAAPKEVNTSAKTKPPKKKEKKKEEGKKKTTKKKPKRGSKGSGSKEGEEEPPKAPVAAKVVKDITLRTSSRAFKGLIKQADKLNTVLHVQDVIVKHDSSSTSSSSTEAGFFHVVEALLFLATVDHVFMQRLLDYQDIDAAGVTFREDNPVDLAYQLVNNYGQLLYVMEQHRICCSSFILFSRKSFVNTLYDRSGNKVLRIIGPTVFMSKMFSPIKITDAHGRLLGYIKAFGTKVNYSVYNARKERMFLVSSNKQIPTPKTIFRIMYLGHNIGEIRNVWNLTHPELTFLDSRDCGISFPVEIDEREKALLIACMTLIEFTWFSPLTRLKLFFVFVALFLSLFTVILFSIPIVLDNPADDEKTLSYYKGFAYDH